MQLILATDMPFGWSTIYPLKKARKIRLRQQKHRVSLQVISPQSITNGYIHLYLAPGQDV